MNLLFYQNDDWCHDLISNICKTLKYNVTFVNNEMSCLYYLLKEDYDLLLIDVKLSIIDIIRIIIKTKDHFIKTPIILLLHEVDLNVNFFYNLEIDRIVTYDTIKDILKLYENFSKGNIQIT